MKIKHNLSKAEKIILPQPNKFPIILSGFYQIIVTTFTKFTRHIMVV